MKLIISIGVGLFFVMIGLYSQQGGFNFGVLNLFGVEELGSADFSWIQKIVDKLLLLPEFISSKYAENLFQFIREYSSISLQQISSGITFFFYFLFSFIPLKTNTIFRLNRDKKRFILLYIFAYFLLLFLLK